MKKLLSLFVLLVAIVTGAWGAASTLPTSGSYSNGVTKYELSNATSIVSNSKIYWATRGSISKSTDYGMRPYQHAFALEVTSAATLTFNVKSNTTDTRTITGQAYTANDAFFSVWKNTSAGSSLESYVIAVNSKAEADRSEEEAAIHANSVLAGITSQKDANKKTLICETANTGIATAHGNAISHNCPTTKGGTNSFTVSLSAAGKYVIYLTSTGGSVGLTSIDINTAGPVAPSISADDVEITNAATEEGEIAFTVANPVTGGAISATNYSEASWLTVGTETTSPISFTATANTGAERSATVRLTYTYNTNETVTKDVTITQAAAKYAITYNKGEYGTGTIAAGEKSYGVDFTLSSSTFTRDGYAQTGWATEDGGTKAYDLGGTYSANAAIELFPVWTAKATDITVTFANGEGAEGVVPAALTDQTEGTEITLPKNFTMYKEGFTLTGWKIGDDVYAPGASYTVPAEDVTLTADYTPNTKTLDDRTAATTIKWDFLRDNGAPVVAWGEGSGAHFWVAQTTVAGETIDVKLPINVTASGKFDNSHNTDWVQINNTTEFTVPSTKDAVISVYVYGEGDASTVNGNARNSYASSVSTFNVTATDATAELIINKGTANSYYKYIQVVFPKQMITPEAGEIFKLNMTYSGKNAVDVTHGTELALGTYGTATSGCDVVIGNKHVSDDTKARITSSGVYFNGNDAYIKIDFNFTLKTGDVITFTNPDSSNRQICFTTTNTRSDSEKTVSNSYTVGSALNGASTIYVWRAETGATYAKTLTISRPIVLNNSGDNFNKGFATYCSSSNFTVTGGTAYKAAISNSKLVMTALEGIIPANTGVVLAGDKGANVTIVKTTDDATANVDDNILKGTTAAALTADLKGPAAKFLAFRTTTSTFTPYGGTNFPANKAYILLDGENAPLSLEMVFDEATGINVVNASEAEAKAAPVKVIKNGKLYIGNYNVAGQLVK